MSRNYKVSGKKLVGKDYGAAWTKRGIKCGGIMGNKECDAMAKASGMPRHPLQGISNRRIKKALNKAVARPGASNARC